MRLPRLPHHPPSTAHQVSAYIAPGVTHRMGSLRRAVAGKAAVGQACVSPGEWLGISEENPLNLCAVEIQGSVVGQHPCVV